MYITFQELFDMKEMKECEIVAGGQFSNNIICWCHVIEIQDPREWAKANLLVLSSGVALVDNPEEKLLKMIKSLSQKKAAGLVLGIGDFIQEIPQSVLDLSNELSFPLITIPQKIQFADISYNVATMIFQKMALLNHENLLLENILTKFETNYEAEFEYYGYLRNVPYRIIIIQKMDTGCFSQSISDAFILELYKLKNIIHRKIFFLNRMNQFVLIIPEIKDSITEISSQSCISRIETAFSDLTKSKNYRIAVSGWAEHPAQLSTCYKQAQTVLEKGDYLYRSKQIVSYSDLGIFNIVDLNKTSELKYIMLTALGDLSKNEDLIDTLQAYIDCDMNMRDTADSLFVHLNTIKYRLKKIDSLLPNGLKKRYIYSIQSGIYIYRILNGSNR